MKESKFTIGLASTIVIGVLAYLLIRRQKQQKRRLVRVADEGYETAYDILYPL